MGRFDSGCWLVLTSYLRDLDRGLMPVKLLISSLLHGPFVY